MPGRGVLHKDKGAQTMTILKVCSNCHVAHTPELTIAYYVIRWMAGR